MALASHRIIFALVSLCLLGMGFSQTAGAGIISTGIAVETAAADERAARLERIETVLAREEVRERLVEWGVDPADASARIAALSDAELATIAERLDEAPAGGDALALIGAVFLVLLILELVGVTDIFKRI